jgi:hypothetical protein
MSAMVLACVVIIGIVAVTGLAFCAIRSNVGLKISASALRMFSIRIEVASPNGRQRDRPSGRPWRRRAKHRRARNNTR